MTSKTRQLHVKLIGGGPWGFRLQGGQGTGSPLTVSKIRRKSKAYNSLCEGDLLIAVNRIPCMNLTYDQVMSIADKTGIEFDIEVERKESKFENPSSEIQQLAKSNGMFNTKETETMVTENTTDAFYKNTSKCNAAISANNETHESIQNDILKPLKVIKKEITFPSVTASEMPGTISNISTETALEMAAMEQTFKRVEIEKHEKHDDNEAMILRTEYEEYVENSPVTCIVNNENLATEIQDMTSSRSMETVLEHREIPRIEKTKTAFSTVNGYVPSIGKSLPSNNALQLNSLLADVQELSEKLESEHIFATPLVTIETYVDSDNQAGSSITSKKKKRFSSSSFYEEPHAIYPTVEEQFEMAKRIAESLADDTNKKSKGANMFYKRAKRSTKWIHEGPEPSNENAPETPEAEAIQENLLKEIYSNNAPKKLKLVLDPRHPVDLASLRSTGHNISEHNVISPEVCHGLVRDLESPVGKGSAMFAKRKKKSSEWIVDEDKVRALKAEHEKKPNQVKLNITKNETSKKSCFKSPWDTALYVSPLGRVHPDELAETVIAAAEVKRRDSIQSLQDSRYDACSPITLATPTASNNDIYKAKAPKGWSAASTVTGMYSTTMTCSSSSQHVETFPAYSNLTTPIPYTRKFNFQNFNSLPRQWKTEDLKK